MNYAGDKTKTKMSACQINKNYIWKQNNIKKKKNEFVNKLRKN